MTKDEKIKRAQNMRADIEGGMLADAHLTKQEEMMVVALTKAERIGIMTDELVNELKPQFSTRRLMELIALSLSTFKASVEATAPILAGPAEEDERQYEDKLVSFPGESEAHND